MTLHVILSHDHCLSLTVPATVILSHYLSIILSYCHTVLVSYTVSYCPIVLVSHNYALSHCLSVPLSYCFTVILSHALSYCPIASTIQPHSLPCKVYVLCMHTNSSPLSNRITDSDIVRELLMLLVVACTLIG